MPRRAATICTYPGCWKRVPRGPRCALHIYARRQDDREHTRRRRADPTDLIHFYDSKEWKRARRYQLMLEPLCRACSDRGRATAGKEVDHIIPMSAGGAEFDHDNLQTLCKFCHSSKTNRERAVAHG
jgi:5-methylcytosine-specific restriction protein A